MQEILFGESKECILRCFCRGLPYNLLDISSFSPMKIAEIFTACRNRLTKISEKEPLSWFSLFLIILFDIFLFSVIATGLSDVTKNVTAPSEYAGYSCLNLLDTDLIANDQDRKASVIRALGNYYSYNYDRSSYYGDNYSYG